MNAYLKKLMRSGLCLLGAAAVCALGIRTVLMRSEDNAPDAVQTAAGGDTPVIVLDAGHGAST
ncbi:MAG: hypothetical protein IKI58_10540 [Oscillospiraceae bacterium]|nr:hypothetical protein [Oscillospiraceae bacterium]